LSEVDGRGLLYLDSSAIVKLVALEPESGALHDWVSRRGDAVVSALAMVELQRAVRRLEDRSALKRRASTVLNRIALIQVDDAILHRAAHLETADLRSLDAIHLATALSIREHLEAFVVYDRRLGLAAESLGLKVTAPG
jgi:predicted nucleic acid-binding protein